MSQPVPLAEALRVIAALQLPQRAAETVPLGHAAGRVLAAPAIARMPMPRFDQAAMDGWAVGPLPPGAPRRLPVVGRLAAGEDAGSRALEGGAIRIFTGAMIPAGTTAVVMQEHAELQGDHVVVPADLVPGQHIRRRAEQAEVGDILVPAGRRLTPAHLGLVAGGGLPEVEVRPMLRVGLLSTGTEVQAPGAALPPGGIPDQNAVMLGALLAGLGTLPPLIHRLPDDPGSIEERARALATVCDLVISTGGASVGEEDHLRALLEKLGPMLFDRLAVKPGRPTALGLLGATPVLALPGTPAAAWTAFQLVGRALVRRLQGEAPWDPRPLGTVAAFAAAAPAGLALAIPVTLFPGPRATTCHALDRRHGTLGTLAEADGLAILAPGRSVAPDDGVLVYPTRS